MRLALLAALGAVAVIPAATATAASPKVYRVADYVEFEPRLGVDARGDAVTTISMSAPLAGGLPHETVEAVFASLRRAGGGFAKPTRVSLPDRAARGHALAVGAGGDGAIVWQSGRRGDPLFVNRRRAGAAAFGPSVGVPGSRGGREPVVAVDARGRMLVAWLAPSSRPRCGMIVRAVVASRRGAFARARRVSPACAHAELVRAALARDGDGAVAWRSAGPRSATSRSSIQVSTYAGRRFRTARSASTAANVGSTLALAAGGHRLIAVWRDHAPVGEPRANRVLSAAVDGSRVAPPVAVASTADGLYADVQASMNVADAAIVAWQQGPAGWSVWDAFAHGEVAIRPSAGAPFGPGEPVGTDVEMASDPGLTGVALDASGAAVAGWGSFVRHRPPAGPWGKPVQLRYRKEDGDPANPAGTAILLGMADDGEAVASWIVEGWDGGTSYLRAAVLAAQR